MGIKKIENHECEIIGIDFKKRVKTFSQVVVISEEVSSEYDMSGFNSPQGNFRYWDAKGLTENSEHILKHIHELSVDDVVHFVMVGTLDKNKLAEKLGLSKY